MRMMTAKTSGWYVARRRTSSAHDEVNTIPFDTLGLFAKLAREKKVRASRKTSISLG
jgi:hypothetical protein